MAVDGKPKEFAMQRKDCETARMLSELLETAEDLTSYGVLSKTDMARMRAICESPPEHPADPNVTLSRS